MKKKAILLLNGIIYILLFEGFSQSSSLKTNLDNLHPVSPTAFQFQKYSDLPVSEYTGIPNISIPIYAINVDGVEVPVSLSYHAGGIRVNQESSWVGLGWDLTTGSVVQTINDKDDYGVIDPSGQPYTKMIPDYNSNPIASEFPLKKNYCSGNCEYGCNGPISINAPTFQHGFKISSDYYAPVNGYYERYVQMMDDEFYDSEPDIFTANFLGHSIKFVRQSNPDRLVVLNKKGYFIERVNGNWKILVPSGEEYYFEEKNKLESYSVSDRLNGGSVSSSWELSSTSWLLTKIITRNKKEINFTYNRTNVNDQFPTFSEKFVKSTLTTTNQDFYYFQTYHRGEVKSSGSSIGPPITGSLRTLSYSRENNVYLTSISFPNGQISFFTSDRIDVIGGKKLDRIEINGIQLIKTYQFYYDYFDANGVVSNGYTSPTGTMATHRLRLNSILDNSSSTYNFTYNAINLPKKNSFATDYWGYYNGQLSNTTMTPNPSQFNRLDISNNGDNHSSNITYAKAGILESIQYPTGGKVQFEFELNEFDNYWVPDLSSSTNAVSKGNGLRVKSVAFKASESIQSKKTNYRYIGGKAILPLQIIRAYSYILIDIGGYPNSITKSHYNIDEVCVSGFFSPSLCGSISGVGYSKVIREDVDGNNLANGRIETNFNNTPDIVTNSANPTVRVSAVLPAFKNKNFSDNGTIQSIYYFDNQNSLIKKIENTYTNILSPIYYGARIFGYGSFVYYTCVTMEQIVTSQHLIGYYPIFDFETLLQSSTETIYANGESLVKTASNYYDELNRLSETFTTNSNSNEIVQYGYPVYGSGTGVASEMFQQNRLMDMLGYRKYKVQGGSQRAVEASTNLYRQEGPLFLIDKTLQINPHPFDVTIGETIFNNYDSKGNLLQYTAPNGIVTTFIWGYDKEYLVAKVIGSDYATVSSFVNQSVLDNPSSTESQIRNELHNIRTGLINTKALVTTFTYKPLGGISSETDPNGRTIYYEYDNFNRLSIIRDNDNKILKKICYNYAGQTEDCQTIACSNTTPNWQATATPYRCQVIDNQNTGYLEMEEQDLNPCSLTANQTRWTIKEYNATACPPSNNVFITYQNTSNATGFTAVYTDMEGTGQSYLFNIPAGSGTLGSIPTGIYELRIYKPGNTMYYYFSCICKYTTGTEAQFYKVYVTQTDCKSIIIQPDL